MAHGLTNENLDINGGEFMSDFIYHHGVKGMKWGVRKDKKSGSSSGKKTVRRKIVKSQDALEYDRLKKKKRAELSNDELRKVNTRGKLLQENKKINPGTIAKGVVLVGAAAAVLGAATKLYNNTNKAVELGKKEYDKIVNKVGDNMISELNAGLKNVKI